VPRLAAHINDAGITLLNGEKILYREPGFAVLDDDRLTTGNEAFARARINPRRIQHRYWSNLATESLADQRFHHLSAADLVSRQLEQMWRKEAHNSDGLIVAVPSYMQSANLGLLLGIAGEIQIPIVALVDAGVAATRREYQNAVPVHVDMSLHATSLTRLAQPGQVQIERTQVVESGGVYALYEAWIDAIAEVFVQQSRFDPLHTADTEQMLLNRLGGWLSEASSQEQVELQIEYAGRSHQAAIESLALIAAAAPVYQDIASNLRALYRAEDTPAIQISDRVARMPGLADMLKARVGGEIFVLEPGATARGALSRCRNAGIPEGGLSLIRQLPWDQSAIALQVEGHKQPDSGVPTHLLFGSTAYEIGNSPLVMGSQEGEIGRFIALAADMPGLSRRHCSLTRINGQCVLEDHSRYGTFLNGHSISGTSVLQVGDSLRVGSPGYEFQLITTDESHG